ncbi:hypothetical protein [Bartonella sp. DGB2]|uniref:hypothetical protein n=2 Tax=Bartonella sp. DGB2 TaxID=3388426 RepID=UPI00398FA3D3
MAFSNDEAVTVRFDLKDANNMLDVLGETQLHKVASASINNTLSKARTKTITMIRKKAGLPAKYRKNYLNDKVRRSAKATPQQLYSKMIVLYGDIPLKLFKHEEQASIGMQVELLGGKQMFAGYFDHGGTFPNRTPLKPKLNNHVFMRDPSKTKRVRLANGKTKLVPRLIRPLGVNAASIMTRDGMQAKVAQMVSTMFQETMQKNINKALLK